ncbi:MAG: peptide deformylase, partial [Deltaproteobacteria bacterium]
MAVREVLVYPDPRLKQVCHPVERFDETLQQLITDLLDTMYDAGHSVGVA